MTGAALTVRPVRLEPHQYFGFTNRGHFFKSPKYAIKINPKNVPPFEPHQYFMGCAATEVFYSTFPHLCLHCSYKKFRKRVCKWFHVKNRFLEFDDD